MAAQDKSVDDRPEWTEKDRRGVTDLSEGRVAPQDGHEHGWIGTADPDKDRDAYTVAGVTGGTAKVTDTPKPAQKPAVKPAS